ncbi:MAG TPA: SRPBCC family protein [Gemmatimonadales bacterium]|nr:SRPBCC family protein [Gemmatimonadales bacterium]
MAQDQRKGAFSGPMDRLKDEARGLAGALGERAMTSVLDKVQGTTGRLSEYTEGGAGPGLMAAVTGAKGLAEGKGPVRSALGAGAKGLTEKVKGLFGRGGKGGKGKKLKVTNIVESIDVGVPIDLAYNQWTQFADFPGFMKKVENVDQNENEPQKSHWKAQVLWSHREWDADIVEQIPEERIIWKSTGAKGHVDGAVTFHQLAPSLTRIVVVLEYHPQGMFEHTGNLWRAQGRRARLELKHFERHVMTNAILHPEEIEGWRGVIEDGEVVQDHGEDQAEDRARDDELADEEYEDDREDVEDTGAGDEYDGAEDGGEEVSPNGREPADRPARKSEGARAAGRGRRPSGSPQRRARAARSEERPQRRRAATRGGNSQ